MKCDESQQDGLGAGEPDLTRKAYFWRLVQRVRIAVVLVLVCLVATWMSGLMDARIDQLLHSGGVYDPDEMAKWKS